MTECEKEGDKPTKKQKRRRRRLLLAMEAIGTFFRTLIGRRR